MQNIYLLRNTLRILFAMYVGVSCIPTWAHIPQHNTTQHNDVCTFFDMFVHWRSTDGA